MSSNFHPHSAWVAMAAMMLSSCHSKQDPPAKPQAARRVIGDQLTLLQYSIGNAWNYGYSVRVIPGEYLIIEHKDCPQAKSDVSGRGICVIRINQKQSDRFAAAMRPFRRYAVPESSFSVDDPDKRPDGKRCRDYTTDVDMITMTWTGTKGSQIATFYTGCDADEFAAFYHSLQHVTQSLPIHGIIADH